MSKKDEYVRKVHSQLDKLSNEIDSLVARTDEVKANARTEYQEKIEALHKKRDDARARLEKLKESGEDAWNDLKVGIEAAWDSIGLAIDSAKSHFKSGKPED